MIGRSLRQYEIVEPLGAGGMGEVYRARDTTLNRDVAIKVLPTDFAADEQRRSRFEREAKLLAALQHPNIATIYGFEEVEDVRFIVLELVEGESLQERLRRGPLPVDAALALSRQVAAALEAAHQAGIVHRDIKPANVVVTASGEAKVLDFGIAKETEERDATDPTRLPTALTEAGVILGTAPYMSPEQVRGGTIDKRTDIWSFGCLLFELLTGHSAFTRATVADTLSAILEVEPGLGTLPSDVPDGVRTLIARCLRKDPGERLHDIADARIELDDLLTGERPAHRPPQRARSSVGLWVAAAVVAVSALLAVWWTQRDGPVGGTGPPSPGTEGARIVVLPFDNLGAPEDDYFAAGMGDEITSRLGSVSGLGVVSRNGGW